MVEFVKLSITIRCNSFVPSIVAFEGNPPQIIMYGIGLSAPLVVDMPRKFATLSGPRCVANGRWRQPEILNVLTKDWESSSFFEASRSSTLKSRLMPLLPSVEYPVIKTKKAIIKSSDVWQ